MATSNPTVRLADAPGKSWSWAVIGLMVLIFGTTLFGVTWRLRGRLRAQIAGRDAQVLAAVVQLAGADSRGDAEWLTELDSLNAGEAKELVLLLESERLKEVVARLKGVVAARLFDPQGELLLALPTDLTGTNLSLEVLEPLRRGQFSSRFHPRISRDELYPRTPHRATNEPAVRPVLEVAIPLRAPGSGQFLGVSQLLLDGDSIRAEYRDLDQSLWRQAVGLFLLGGGVMVAGLAWAFQRLERTHRTLSDRTHLLAKANMELALAAKTSAVGTVAAHLIHGLRNPLSGLRSFVTTRGLASAESPAAEWEEAANAARRMQEMIEEVVRVLREDSGGAVYELAWSELVELVVSKAQGLAEERGVKLLIEGAGTGWLDNRRANLVLLILENILANALQATPAGKTVRLSWGVTHLAAEFTVRDQGPGFPEALRARLFQPGQSAKARGSGIGLALSKQLANHLGAQLELKESTPEGCLFSLVVNLEGT